MRQDLQARREIVSEQAGKSKAANRITAGRRVVLLLLAALFLSVLSCGCSGAGRNTSSKGPETFVPDSSMTASQYLIEPERLQSEADAYTPVKNEMPGLWVPTYVNHQDGLWFLVDCYHNQIICHNNMTDPLTDWDVLPGEMSQPHTIASDGKVYLADDTENNRVVVFEKIDGKLLMTQIFDQIGNRPHFTAYDKATDTFYVWSSRSGELYCFRHAKDDSRVYLTEVKKVDELSGIYIRSFTIIGDKIYFVSGFGTGQPAQILCCSLDTLEVLERYDVPDELAGMVQITPVGSHFLITTSTDISGNQDAATMVRVASLDDLSSKDYEDVYTEHFIGGGTPYYITKIDDRYYLCEHRIPEHSIWSFSIDKDDQITNVEALY